MLLVKALGVQLRDIVTFVGAGGKTTLMFRLASELATSGQRVVSTMTTHIFVGQMSEAPGRLIVHTPSTLLAQLPDALAEHMHVLLASDTIVQKDRVEGLSPVLLDRVAAQSCVDNMVIEGDGSRRLPFKAPAEHEPVIPTSTTIVVPVVGLDVLDKPLLPEYVHRPQIVAALTGASLGSPVTPEVIAGVLTNDQGGQRGVPPGARLVPFLNKVEEPMQLDAARCIARLLLATPAIDRVAIGAAQAADPVIEVWGRVGAVILAAGAGTRYGGLKQAMRWQGIPMVAQVVDRVRCCPDVSKVVVTVGAGADRVRDAVADRDVMTVTVPGWEQGQSHSVRTGLAALLGDAIGAPPAVPLGAVIFLLADQPAVTSELLAALIQRHRETLAPIVAPRYRGKRGNPVLFDRSVFAEFDSLTGDIGARPLIERHFDEIAWLDWEGPEIVQDIDTVADYRLQE